MAFFNLYKPFVEAPTKRTTVTPSSGGITIDIGTAQGVSFRNPILRQTTLLPQINSGRTDFVVDCFNFGSSQPVDEAIPFKDKERLTAEKYIQDPNQFGFPLFVGDYLPIDGAIEPLEIRSVATRESIEDPTSHRVRGHIMDGNEDSFDGSDLKSSFILYKKNSDFVPFEDFSDSLAGGLVVFQGFVANSLDDKVEPFDESKIGSSERFTINNNEIVSAWQSLENSGIRDSRYFDDDFRPLNTKAATSGFVYGNNPEGTDSLAFGGFLRG